jgi:hypothetical protein
MKRCFVSFIWLVLTSVCTFASPTIYKTWIGENLQYLKLTKDKANFYYGSKQNDYGVSYKDSTLIFIDYFYTSGKTGRQHEDYIYKVVKLTNDTLIVSPLNDRASKLIGNKEQLLFIDKSTLYQTDLKFQRLFFSGTPCLGSCPGMKIEIDSLGVTYFFAESNTGDYKGLYKGKLSKKQLNKLIEILKTSELDRFPTELGKPMDAPTYNFKFSYNNKIKTSNGYFVPYLDKPLLTYLLTIYKEMNFEKIDGTYEFGK